MGWTDIKLNDKYREWIYDSFDNIYNVLEGSWRSGKTVALITAHIIYLDNLNVSGLHIIAAESISTARTILLNNPAGFSYTDFFAERAEEGQFEGKEALRITNSKGHVQTLVFVGSSKANSYQKIRGLTAYSVLITEVNIAHKTFVHEAIGRTIAADPEDRKLFFDLNPKGEQNFFYTEFLNGWQERAEDIGLNYMRTTFFDNPSLEEEQKTQIKKEYDPESILYKAYILGERVESADNMFNLYSYNTQDKLPTPDAFAIFADPGQSISSTVYILAGVKDGILYIYDLYHHKNGRNADPVTAKQASDYAVDLVEFTKKQEGKFGRPPERAYIDRDISFMRECQKAYMAADYGKGYVQYAIKKDLEERTKTLGSLLYKGKVVIQSDLTLIQDAIKNAKFDSDELDKNGKLVREDKPKPGKDQLNPIDIIDTLDYAIAWAQKYKIY